MPVMSKIKKETLYQSKVLFVCEGEICLKPIYRVTIKETDTFNVVLKRNY